MAAASYGRVECARALLAGGADRTLQGTHDVQYKGQTALEIAEARGEAEVAIVLGARLSEAEKAEWAQRKERHQAFREGMLSM